MIRRNYSFLSFTLAFLSFLMLSAIAGRAQQYSLTVSKEGSGSGTVTSSPAGVNCGSDCSEPYNQGTKITLKVKADPGSTFKGWSGGCTGTKPSCKLTMTSDQTVIATFGLPDLRGELSDVSVSVVGSSCGISGKLMVYADEGKAAGVKARLYLSYDEAYYQDGDLLGSVTIGTINAASSKSKSFKYKGTYNPSGRYVLAVIDPDSAIREANEANNITVSYYRGEAAQLEVIPDEASRVSGVIEHGEGSTLETTSGGSGLSLTILPHSFMTFPEISLTGVSEIGGLPQTITMLAGAQMGSEGLRLMKPATLTIALPSAPSTGTLIGFISQDNGRGFQLYPIEVNGSTATFEMTHFTSVGVGKITGSDISTPGNPSWLTGQALAGHRIAIADLNYKLNPGHLDDVSLWEAYKDEIAGILEDWYFGKGGILDQLEYVPEDPEAFIPIINQFVRWTKYTDSIGFLERPLTKEQPCGLWSGEDCSTFGEVEGGGKDAIVNTIKDGIIAANKACLDGDFTKDAIALKWLLLADSLQERGVQLFTAADAIELWELKTCGAYSLEVSPSQATIDVGGTVPLQAIVKDKGGKVLSGYSVFWYSDDKGIAAVDRNSGLVTGIGGGTASVFAFLRQNYFLYAQSDITVTPPVASVVVTPSQKSMIVGNTFQFTATAKDATGNVLSGLTIIWSSDKTTVATVNQTGLVTAVGNGGATITATFEGVSGTANVTVTAKLDEVRFNITADPRWNVFQPYYIKAGGKVRLIVTGVDSAGNAITSGFHVNWSIYTDPSFAPIVTIDANGTITLINEEGYNVCTWPVVTDDTGGIVSCGCSIRAMAAGNEYGDPVGLRVAPGYFVCDEPWFGDPESPVLCSCKAFPLNGGVYYGSCDNRYIYCGF